VVREAGETVVKLAMVMGITLMVLLELQILVVVEAEQILNLQLLMQEGLELL